jgi:DNA gyrase subunit A
VGDPNERTVPERLHVVEGLLRALDDRDAILSAIGGSEDRRAAIHRLQEQPFGLSIVQANYVLDMTWSRSTRLARRSLIEERVALLAALEEP